MHKSSLVLLAVLISFSAFSQRKKSPTPTDAIQAFTEGLSKKEGFIDFFYDEKKGRVFLLLEDLGQELLYVNSLAAGVGSNDIGLDRGQLGAERVVKFERFGPKVLLIQPNQDYRAVSENEDEVRSVEEAFASSVLGGFKVEAEHEGKVLIDVTAFLMRDSHGISRRLRISNQGSYSIDNSRSTIYPAGLLNFPKNTELESILTFKGEAKGQWIRSVTPTSDAVTVRTHHSFIELPDDNYEKRAFDPRSGFIHIRYQDYATAIEDDLVKRFVVRHRLQKKDPSAAVSDPVEPIVYYVDRGAPEPIRSALIEGASWWAQAFEAAGFSNAFRVEVLPEDAHPLDVRYNVIQWVHRSTRGWSYGASVVDPRTGEILKGHVSLGSLRVRQDFLIAEGLLNPYEEGKGVPNDMTEMALARLRQLSAHEVGHTIGLVHNFAASFNDRASVMDYPHPLVKLDDSGNIDLSEAYDTNIGEWDKIAIQYGYGEYENPDEAKAVLKKASEDGYLYITDRDARPQDGLHPIGHLWDNGKNAAQELTRMMQIRRKVLDNFSEKSIQDGEPMSSIEEVLVPMYLFHRYQVDGTSKVVGGLRYSYATKGDGQLVTAFIEPSVQQEAIQALVSTLQPEALRLSKSLLQKIPPKAHGHNRSRETFISKTGPAFDYFAAVETAASVPIAYLLNTGRANRLEMYKSIDNDQPGLQFLLDELSKNTWYAPSSNAGDRELQKIVEMEYLAGLFNLYTDPDAYDGVKAIVLSTLTSIKNFAGGKRGAYYTYAVVEIEDFLENPEEYERPKSIKAPDGSPIGSDAPALCSFGH